MRPEILLTCSRDNSGYYTAYLKVDSESIWIDKILLTIEDCDDLHSKLAPAFSRCGIALALDIRE